MNTSNISFTLASSTEDLQQIITLQAANLERHISNDEAVEQGFVTVVHDLPLLEEMNRTEQSIIAKDGERVVGYCLSMPTSFRDLIPVLVPMFEKIDHLSFKNSLLKDSRYLVMGQVCIDKAYRGRGVFDGMYAKMQAELSSKYDYLITEIASRNTRSRRAHQRVGFEDLLSYSADAEQWELVLWDWRKR